MPKLLTVEKTDENLPLICIYGEYSSLIERFLKDNREKFRVIFVSSKRPEQLSDRNDIYYLTYEEAQVLPRLEDKIDYALLYLQAPIQKKYLNYVSKKLQNDKTKSVVLINPNLLETFYDVILEHKNDGIFHFGILGDIIDVANIKASDALSQLIGTAMKNGEIKLTGNDLTPVFAISQTDALKGIYRLLFGNFDNKNIFYLFYNHPETILASTHLIARVEPDLKIIFSEGEVELSKISREIISELAKKKLQMEVVYMDTYFDGFEKTLEKILNGSPKDKKQKSLIQENFSIVKEKVAKKRVVNPILTSLIFGFLLYIFLNTAFLIISIFYLKVTIGNISNGKYKNVMADSTISKSLLNLVKPSAYLFLNAVSLVDTKGYSKKTFSLLENAADLSVVTGDSFQEFLKNSLFSQNNIENLASNFIYLYTQGEEIVLKQNNETLTNLLNPSYSKILSLSSVMPYVLGYTGERNYLLLFQNNDELRPNGGFIGSVGQLSLKDGAIENLQVQDVYSLDGQLKEHVEPPFVVRRYLQPHLYLRDSNFSLDFQETASKAAFIYNLETGKKPDAVIAINFDVLKQVLKIIGPIPLSDYNITVTDKNIGDFLQSAIQTNFFPGSTQKKDVLNKVLSKVLQNLNDNKNLYIKVAKLIPSLLDEKNIMFAFSDQSIQKVFNANNYGGQLYDLRTPDKNTIEDFLAINEANIGVNKANAYVSRQVEYTAFIGTDKLESKANITLTNVSPKDDYKVYLQIAVPSKSQITNIAIDGQKQDIVPAVTDPKLYENKNFKPPKGLEVESYEKNGHTIFAFITTVKKGSQEAIEVDYTNGASITLSTIAKYSLLYVKQPGTEPYKLTTTVYFPDDYSPTDTKADSYGKNFLQSIKNITTDTKITLEIKKEEAQ